MTMLAVCRCGPRSTAPRVDVVDAARSAKLDPTGTLDLRTSFKREMDARWQKLKTAVTQHIDRNDSVGLGQATSVIPLPGVGGDAVRQFQAWMDGALWQIVLGGDGSWMRKYVEQAAQRASERAFKLTGVKDDGPPDEPRDDHGMWTSSGGGIIKDKHGVKYAIKRDDNSGINGFHYSVVDKSGGIVADFYLEKDNKSVRGAWVYGNNARRGIATAAYVHIQKDLGQKLHASSHQTDLGKALWNKFAKIHDSSINEDAAPTDRTPTLLSLAVTELQGIEEAVSQQAVRAFAGGLLAGQRPSQVARAVGAIINKVGVERGRMLVSFAVVKTFSAATLDAFRAAGVTSVGTKAEKLRVVKGPHGKTLAKDAPSDVTLELDPSLRSDLLAPLGEVDVLTAGDNDVCLECEDISDSGPYDIDEAETLIPAHPNCRCAFVPTADERFAPVGE